MNEGTAFEMADGFDFGAVRRHDENPADGMPHVFPYTVDHIGKRVQIFVDGRNDDVDFDIRVRGQ
ncbi:hypothetical protein PBN151_2702 [Paenibacillus sp. NAIST15-1]|nr:hypothetical protein PBN151_2702 [Paenibacillus sp. NAIST15-1]